MKTDITATGKTVAEALENAKKELGVEILDEDVNGLKFEILEQPKKSGFLGLRSLPAKVRVYSTEAEAAPEKPEPAPTRSAAQTRREPVKADGASAQNTQKKDTAPRAPRSAQNKQSTPPQQNPQNTPRRAENNRPKKQKRPIPEAKPMPVLESTAEELQNDPALLFVRKLLADLELEARAEMLLDEENMRRILIYGEDACSLIGHHGETLDAFQYLANLAVMRHRKEAAREGISENKARVTIDIENYRAKREETLRALARRMAAKALKYKHSVMLEPMNPYERRIIHSEIQNIEGVSTNSVGTDNNRKIVIYLTDEKKPAGQAPETDGESEE